MADTDNTALPAAPLDLHTTAFEHFEAIDEANGKLEGTMAVMSKLIDDDCGLNADIIVTLERHLKADFAAVIAACTAAREAILTPLHAAAPAVAEGLGQ